MLQDKPDTIDRQREHQRHAAMLDQPGPQDIEQEIIEDRDREYEQVEDHSHREVERENASSGNIDEESPTAGLGKSLI